MQHDFWSVVAQVAWPVVALIGILILGPGGTLKGLIGEVFKISQAVNDFKKTAQDFNKTQADLKESMSSLGDLQSQLLSINQAIKTVEMTTDQLAVSEGSRSLASAIGELPVEPQKEQIGPTSAEEMLASIRSQWIELTEKLKVSVGAERYDGRAIGATAWLLTDGRRKKNRLDNKDAQLIERLHGQFKRFTRLSASKDEWLTHEVYAAFSSGVQRALNAL